ncbi:MAG: glycosyltransferase family 9 protein [Candidatus Altiarchaeota archaeon]|nr:glycosyltransferase family 9 protein [Candidatus Altiarchaeota archaeon]
MNKGADRDIDFDKVGKILVLNMIPNTIGDSLFLSPLFRILKKNLPDKHVAVTATSTNRELFLNNPHVDEIIFLKDLAKIGERGRSRIHKAFIYARLLAGLIIRLRREKFDLCFVGVPNFSILQIVPFLSGIRYSVGYEYPGMYFSFLLTRKGPFHDQTTPQGRSRHYIESVLDLLRFAGLDVMEEDKVVEKVLTHEELRKADAILMDNGVAVGRAVVSIQAGAKWRSKCWPRERFARLGKELVEKCGVDVVLLGSPGEHGLNDEINRLAGGCLINLSGNLSLTEIAGILKRSALIVGNDSGLMHLASAVGTKTVVLYGSTDPGHSKPLGLAESVQVLENDFCEPCTVNKANCPHNYKCMDAISVETVLSIIQKSI